MASVLDLEEERIVGKEKSTFKKQEESGAGQEETDMWRRIEEVSR